MSVFFSSEPAPDNPQRAELWELLEHEHFEDAMDLAEPICENPQAPIAFFRGLSLAYGESGYYADAERVARTATSFGEANWHARHALGVSLMHQGRFFAAVDSLGFHRTPAEIYVIRAQVEIMGDFQDGLRITLQDALQQDVPAAIELYLAYLYGIVAKTMPGWEDADTAFDTVYRLADYLDVWERDVARHAETAYGRHLARHVSDMRQIANG